MAKKPKLFSRLISTILLCSVAIVLIDVIDAVHLCVLENNSSQIYNGLSEICCGRKLSRRVEGQACCDLKTLYYEERQICCGGKVIDYDPSEESCCGNQIFNKTEAMCCNNTIVFLTAIQKHKRDVLGCCNKTVYNKRKKKCCGGQTHLYGFGCCEGKVFSESERHCVRGEILVKDELKCGKNTYNIYKNGCCNGVLHQIPERNSSLGKYERNPNLECCDTLPMDPNKEQCCRKHHFNFETHTIPQQPHLHCCGNGFYNKSRQICFDGKAVDDQPDKVWCGGRFVDGKDEKCCNGIIPYMKATQECCSGSTLSVIQKNQTCCNGVGVKDNEMCCAGQKPVAKEKENDDACCFDYSTQKGQTYHRNSTLECIEGILIMKPDKDYELCPKGDGSYEAFNPKTEFCCGNEVIPFSSGYDDCCNDRPYNSSAKLCCWHQSLSDISPTEGSCCPKDQKAHRFDDPQNPCGSKQRSGANKTYNIRRRMCRKGRMSRRKNRSRCKNKTIVPKMRSLRRSLCRRKALRSFRGLALEHACRSKYAIRATITDVEISRRGKRGIRIFLSDVVNLNRGVGLKSWKGNENLVFDIRLRKKELVKCRARYLKNKNFPMIIAFFNKEANEGRIVLSQNSDFFITGYNKARERKLVKEYCEKCCI